MELMDDDFLLALELQEQLDKESWKPSAPPSKPTGNLSIVDESWEYLDPNPDIRELFLQFNAEFFWGRLAGIEVKWSPRMTLCAGLCVYEGRGGLCSVRLSQPLLKLRPRKDLVETLLHEMIHAYLFVTDNNKDHDGHGPEFHKHMHRINNATGTQISVYHNFHDEVDNYRQHWWRCNGPCQNRKPFFGYVKRAMNRAPSERDPWWNDHKRTCNGTYIKIKEPEGYGKKKSKEKSEKDKSNQEKTKSDTKKKPDIRPFLGKGHVFPSGKLQQKVIVNGVLTTLDKNDKQTNNCNKPSTSTCTNDDMSDNEDLAIKPRTSVSAITTSGKISDKELLRQRKLAELMLSDSDDDDLVLCDAPAADNSLLNSQENMRKTNIVLNCDLESNLNENDCLLSKKKQDHLPIKSLIKNNSEILQINTEKQNLKSDKSRTSDLSILEGDAKSCSQSSSSDVASKVRNIWANKQFGSSLKPLDPKANSINLIPSKSQKQAISDRMFNDDNIKQKPLSNKRLSGDDANGSRKKLKTETGHTTQINDMFTNITKQQSENSEPCVARCPVCNKSVLSSQINQHLDLCLTTC